VTTRLRVLRLTSAAGLAATFTVPGRRESMTMTRPAIIRLAVGVPLALAVLFSVPAQRGGVGITIARAGMTSSLGTNAHLHRMSNGKIAFIHEVNDISLDVINPDGSGPRRLVRCKTQRCMIIDAVWSPDGKRIAFVRGPTGSEWMSLSDLSVYVMNANGSGERRVASCIRPPEYFGCWSNSLAWSPDGTSLAIARSRSLYVFDLSTGRLRRVTAPLKCDVACSPDVAPVDLAPAWSPDGSRIAFARALHGCIGVCPTELFVVNADGAGLRRLSSVSSGLSFGLYALWSPDGRTITYSARHGIYAVDPNGSPPRLLVPAPPARAKQVQMLASSSSDGRNTLYITAPSTPTGGQPTALCVMNAKGTGRRCLYRARHGFLGPAVWSPDGQLIAFSVLVYPSGNGPHIPSKSGLFVMAADGGHLHRLMPAYNGVAGWQPIP
jgi:Tol biopolymer transport system component